MDDTLCFSVIKMAYLGSYLLRWAADVWKQSVLINHSLKKPSLLNHLSLSKFSIQAVFSFLSWKVSLCSSITICYFVRLTCKDLAAVQTLFILNLTFRISERTFHPGYNTAWWPTAGDWRVYLRMNMRCHHISSLVMWSRLLSVDTVRVRAVLCSDHPGQMLKWTSSVLFVNWQWSSMSTSVPTLKDFIYGLSHRSVGELSRLLLIVLALDDLFAVNLQKFRKTVKF